MTCRSSEPDTRSTALLKPFQALGDVLLDSSENGLRVGGFGGLHERLSGDLLPLVITNYVATQGRKPPPKQAARKPPRRGKGATQESKPTTPQTPEKPEPSIALVTDFPRSPAQAESLLSSAFPAICWIMLEGPPEPEKKGGVATPPPDWRELFSRDIPFFTYNFAEGNAEETIHRMINDIFSSSSSTLYSKDATS